MEVKPTSICRDLGQIADAIARHRKWLGMSQMALDQRTGLHWGYVGKLEAWRTPKHGRRLGNVSLPLMLEALGLALVVVKVKTIPRPRPPAPAQLSFDLRGGKINQPSLAIHPKPE